MDLAVAYGVFRRRPRAGQGLRVATEVACGFCQRRPIPVLEFQEVLVEGAGEVRAAEVGRAEPEPLFVGEGGDLDGEGQPFAPVVQAFDAGEGGEDAERAIVLPGVAHGVEVRAEDEGPFSRPP